MDEARHDEVGVVAVDRQCVIARTKTKGSPEVRQADKQRSESQASANTISKARAAFCQRQLEGRSVVCETRMRCAAAEAFQHADSLIGDNELKDAGRDAEGEYPGLWGLGMLIDVALHLQDRTDKLSSDLIGKAGRHSSLLGRHAKGCPCSSIGWWPGFCAEKTDVAAISAYPLLLAISHGTIKVAHTIKA